MFVVVVLHQSPCRGLQVRLNRHRCRLTVDLAPLTAAAQALHVKYNNTTFHL